MGPLSVSLPSDAALSAALRDLRRLDALRDLGFSNMVDPEMERYAFRVRDALGVPMTLVSLVSDTEQYFPGATGLGEPWCDLRATPLTHSLCQYVVGSAEPVILPDLQSDPVLRVHQAATDLGVAAYAGIPLTDDDGRVLGSLCALDTVPHDWSAQELSTLTDLAHDVRNALRLRLARLASAREQSRMTELERSLGQEISRSQWMLSMAEALNETRTVDGVRARLARFVEEVPGFEAARLRLADELDLNSARVSPVVRLAAETGQFVHHPDLRPPVLAAAPGSIGPELSQDDLLSIRQHYAGAGVRAVGALPVVGASRLLGVIELLWSIPRPLSAQDAWMATAMASYVSHSLERAHLIQRRTTVAHELQQAMLTTLPEVPGLSLAAVYVPATAEDWVGGDWYDAIVLPSAERDTPPTVAVTVGDVMGHDIPAAAVMGQARAMLRQAQFDQPAAGPAAAVTQFETACGVLGVEAHGSLVLAYLEPSPSGAWTMTWTAAGHPAPLLALPDGTVVTLEVPETQRDMLFGYRDLYDGPRHDTTVELPPGSTVLFYTDGVVEIPGTDADQQTAELRDLLAQEHDHGPQYLVDAISMNFGNGSDDVVALAVQVPWQVSTVATPAS